MNPAGLRTIGLGVASPTVRDDTSIAGKLRATSAVVGIFVGGFIHSQLPRGMFGAYDDVARPLVVGGGVALFVGAAYLATRSAKRPK